MEKEKMTVDKVCKKVELDIYKAVSQNLEDLKAAGNISKNLDINKLSKTLADHTKIQIRDHWVENP